MVWKLLYKLCLHLQPPAMGDLFTVVWSTRLCGPTGWLALLLIKNWQCRDNSRPDNSTSPRLHILPHAPHSSVARHPPSAQNPITDNSAYHPYTHNPHSQQPHIQGANTSIAVTLVYSHPTTHGTDKSFQTCKIQPHITYPTNSLYYNTQHNIYLKSNI